MCILFAFTSFVTVSSVFLWLERLVKNTLKDTNICPPDAFKHLFEKEEVLLSTCQVLIFIYNGSSSLSQVIASVAF